jgi:hypothetical protein
MNLSPIFRRAFASLTRNWLRSVLTILGISVGVGAFICVVAIGNMRAAAKSKTNCKVWATTLYGSKPVAARGTASERALAALDVPGAQ